ncbi:MAG: hypothetical protein GC164_14050 [Phycisphaera sp.]|nr:hypothetical protein [Phycisphaera sp.]
MKKNEIRIGGTYMAKVTDKVVPVRIDVENPHGGWDATNLATNKKVRIKSAQRLRGPAPERTAPKDQPEKKPVTKEQREALHAQPPRDKADQENARPRDEGKGKKKSVKQDKPKKLSLINAAAQVLADASDGLNAKQMVEAVAAKGLWKPGVGKTPHATLYAAIIREIGQKGKDARFTKVERGLFQLRKGA